MAFGGNPVLNSDKRFKQGGGVQPAPAQGQFGQQQFGQQGQYNQQGQFGQQQFNQPYMQAGMNQPGYLAPSAEQLQQQFNQGPPSNAVTGRMTYDDVLIKTLGTFAVLLVGAVLGWFIPALIVVGAIGGLVLGLVNSFKREPSRVLILLYAVLEGVFVGGISSAFNAMFDGIVLQAVIGTLGVFALALALFKFANFRATGKMMKFFMLAMGGYLIFSIVNLVLVMFHATDNPWGVYGMRIGGFPIGVLISIVAIGLAAFSLIMDFTNIENGVRNGLPARYSWTAAFGLTVTLVWLYVEILRLLAVLRNN